MEFKTSAIFFFAACCYYFGAIIYLAVRPEENGDADKDMMAMFLLWIVPFIVIVGTILITGVIALLWALYSWIMRVECEMSYEEI